MKLRRNDNVLVTRGKDRGKSGRILAVDLEKGRLLIEGINTIKRHVRPSPNLRQAGIVERPGPLAVSKVKLLCTKCGKPVRVGFKVLPGASDGQGTRRVRVCRKCHEEID